MSKSILQFKRPAPEKKSDLEIHSGFQTPPPVCEYMVDLIPAWCRTILEPFPGVGNLQRAIEGRDKYQVTAPANYFKLPPKKKFDCVVMNPPFSEKFVFGTPEEWRGYDGMKIGYKLLRDCMAKSRNIIALMPYFTITDSDLRIKYLKNFGIISITGLPRSTFQYSRIQTIILELEKGYSGPTEFKLIH